MVTKATAPKPYLVGDTVRLRGAPTVMTVIKLEPAPDGGLWAFCVWLDKTLNMIERKLPLVALERAR